VSHGVCHATTIECQLGERKINPGVLCVLCSALLQQGDSAGIVADRKSQTGQQHLGRGKFRIVLAHLFQMLKGGLCLAALKHGNGFGKACLALLVAFDTTRNQDVDRSCDRGGNLLIPFGWSSL